jgi:glycosyltransferase involved in cell wall biosynthesis
MIDQIAGRMPQRDQELTTMDCTFTIVIPTLAVRPKELGRAIASLLGQNGGKVVPLVVVNGDRYDPDLVQHLRQRRDIRFHQIAAPGVAGARYEGRKLVDTPYFGFLDDDDEYLPDALVLRFRQFETRPDVDVVVGNGWRVVACEKHLVWQDTEAIAARPDEALMNLNWLASCGPLFKTETVGPEYFDFDLQYLEWTYLALHLALTRKLSFVPEPTFIVHDTPNSVSDSDVYVEAHTTVLNRMLNFEMPLALRRKLRKKILDAHHNLSTHYRRRGPMSAAWKYHLRSMTGIHGLLRYGAYTRKLLVLFPPRLD